MSEPQEAGRMLEMAQQAAIAGDLASAEELLTGAARIQEAELGPLHPDLANTLNNLAIVAEQTGRLGDAEAFYRRAVAIASASLPAGDPTIAASRENLEDFCRAHGLPVAGPVVTMPPALDTASALEAFAPERAAGAIETPASTRAGDAAPISPVTPPPSRSPSPASFPSAARASQPLPASLRTVSRSLAWATIGVVVTVAAAALLVRGPSSPRETSTPAPTGETLPPQAAEPAQQPRAGPPAMPDPVERARPSTPRDERREVTTAKPEASSRSSGGITLATAQLCRSFSTSGANWRCDPAADSVPPGRLVFYTRVKSPRDAVVVHRWYRGDTLQQSVKLTIRANATEGYRTFSRQTVDGVGDWRVEVRSAEGRLLHERRFTVR